ncbi:hypothetical protein [Nodosilinea sp. E11]|uniref:hypothetical protein n=1 Tax=Nodosilinea sp. E11 TaxID=3037479 RepID=UPI0029345768|nr:hypothetical protein [Nodosilinea sp. E11]WOD38660.1 hypothetical protein RRF56_20835 [Nodosilinea sp. E11]
MPDPPNGQAKLVRDRKPLTADRTLLSLQRARENAITPEPAAAAQTTRPAAL